MGSFEDELMGELQEGFLFEARDLLAKVENLSLQIEKNPSDDETFQELARLAHNLKGSGKAVGFDEISKLAHHAEDYILAIRHHKIANNADTLDLLFQCLDVLRNDVERLIENRQIQLDYGLYCEQLSQVLNRQGATVEKVAQDNIEELMAQIQQMEEATKKQEVLEQPKVSEVQAKSNQASAHAPKSTNESIRIPKSKLDYLLDAFGEQVILQSTLEQCKHDIKGNEDLLVKTISLLSKHTLEMQKQVLSLTTVQLSPLYMKIERAIRDAAKLCHKKIEVHFYGGDTEADKSLVDSLSDPLTHMVRNAVDHGIESDKDRIASGKSEIGNIYIEARRVGGQIWIDITDDGGGMNPEKIKNKAIQKNIISQAQAEKMTDQESFKLIFANGFSTKEETSEVSGRGVGMNVVEEVIASLNGSIHIDSQLGQGTCFRLKLPLSLAIFNGAVVRVQNSRYVVPTSDITEIVRLPSSEQVVCSEKKTGLQVRDHIYEVYDLRSLIGGKKNDKEMGAIQVLLSNKGKRKAFIVDEVLGIQKVVQKPIGEELKSCPGFAAATILSDGAPGVVLSLQQIKKAG